MGKAELGWNFTPVNSREYETHDRSQVCPTVSACETGVPGISTKRTLTDECGYHRICTPSDFRRRDATRAAWRLLPGSFGEHGHFLRVTSAATSVKGNQRCPNAALLPTLRWEIIKDVLRGKAGDPGAQQETTGVLVDAILFVTRTGNFG